MMFKILDEVGERLYDREIMIWDDDHWELKGVGYYGSSWTISAIIHDYMMNWKCSGIYIIKL